MGFTSVNSCCCFDLRTGGLIMGYLDLASNIFMFFRTFFSYGVIFALLLLIVTGSWLYGIHADKHLYMLPYFIWTVIAITIVCIGFIVVTIASVFGLGMIDTIHQRAISEDSIKVANMRFDIHSAEHERELAAREALAGGMVFLYWFIFAIMTGIFWFLTVVKISLYNQMKAKSSRLGQQPLPLTQNGNATQIVVGNIGGPQMSQTRNFGVYPQVPQTGNFEANEITKMNF